MDQGFVVRRGLFLARRLEGMEALLGVLGEDFSSAMDTVLGLEVYGAEFGMAYLEIPLAGEAGFDLHLCYFNTPEMRWPEQNASLGLGPFINWNAAHAQPGQAIDLAYDLRAAVAAGQAEVLPGTYCVFQGRPGDRRLWARESAMAPGFEGAADAVGRFVDALPEGLTPYYLGVMPQRASQLTRIGLHLSAELEGRACNDPDVLVGLLGELGFGRLEGLTARQLRQMAQACVANDLQLDLACDGTLGPTLGVSLYTPALRPLRQRDAATTDRVARLIGLVKSWGLADERADLLPRLEHVWGTGVLKGLEIVPGVMQTSTEYIKIRWRDGVPLDAKAYVLLRANTPKERP